MNLTKCRSCGASIFWGTTSAGKQMPLDPNPYTIAVFGGADSSPCGLTAPDGEIVLIDRFVRGYNSHFASCPNANAHRKGTT